MISIVYCTREKNDKHKEHLLKVCGNPKVEIIEYINKGESLTKFYNKALLETSNDIVVFVHDDIIVNTKQLDKRINRMFDKNPEYGIIGVAGTKYLPDTGRWWDKPKFMYGRVSHTHQGKTWLSEYSPDQNVRIEETVIVDGVFFAVHKNRIKKQFDESVEGFHFYDVDFCFQNHLEGVKVGVTTEIKINHMSIGMTNDEWEINRQQFVEKYRDKLPVSVNETFEHRKLNIMIASVNENGNITDKLDLCKSLSDLNCDITLVSNYNIKELMLLKQSGIKLTPLSEPPGFKTGDGRFTIQGPNGPQLSEVGKIYKLGLVPYDIIYSDNEGIFKSYKKMYPECNIVDIESKEYYLCDKTPMGYKKLFINTFNDESTTD
jgi:hypothetical protein